MRVLGVALELSGLVLLLWPEGWPFALDKERRARAQTTIALTALQRRATTTIRRILRRPQDQTVHAGTAVGTSSSLGVSVGRGAFPHVTIEASIRHLLEQERDTREQLDDLRGQIGALAERHDGDLARLRVDLESQFRRAIEEAVTHHRGLRVAGSVLVLLGALVLAVLV
jgi:hypothetical protein